MSSPLSLRPLRAKLKALPLTRITLKMIFFTAGTRSLIFIDWDRTCLATFPSDARPGTEPSHHWRDLD